MGLGFPIEEYSDDDSNIPSSNTHNSDGSDGLMVCVFFWFTQRPFCLLGLWIVILLDNQLSRTSNI